MNAGRLCSTFIFSFLVRGEIAQLCKGKRRDGV